MIAVNEPDADDINDSKMNLRGDGCYRTRQNLWSRL